jgi:transposase
MENREMQTSNTAEMVTISRAEYEQLQQENAQLEAKSAKLEEAHTRLEAKLAAREQEQAQVITSLTLQNEWLLEQLKLSKKKLFGRSSEQAEQMVMEQLSFTYVPAGTGIQSSRLEAVPADDGQLAAEGLREVAAVGLRCAA